MLIKKSIYLIYLVLFLFSSCRVIDFGNDEVICNPSSFSYSFDQEYVMASFNCEVDHYAAEQCVKLEAKGQSVSLIFKWIGNTVYAKPECGWINGRYYEFSIVGAIAKTNNSQFPVNYKCSFVYGGLEQRFILTQKPDEDSPYFSNETLIYSFNHEISYVNFSKGFKLSPSENLNYSISNDQKTVFIKPETGWKINTIYNWEFEDLVSVDDWELSGIKKGVFITQTDIENPELVAICPVSDSSDSALWLENTDIDRNISKRECIGLKFSKSMDFSSIKSGITIMPSVSGYFSCASEDYTRFLFVPLAEYEIGTKYLITISSTVKDSIGNNIYEDIKKEFVSGDSFLKLSSINIGGSEYSNAPYEVTAATTYLDDSEILSVVIVFSHPINQESRYSVVNNISLGLNFPMSSTSPILLSTKWDSSNQIISFIWGNITKSTTENSSYYDLKTLS